jgi:hypothetical protein
MIFAKHPTAIFVGRPSPSGQNRIKSGYFGAFVVEMKKSIGILRWLVGIHVIG